MYDQGSGGIVSTSPGAGSSAVKPSKPLINCSGVNLSSTAFSSRLLDNQSGVGTGSNARRSSPDGLSPSAVMIALISSVRVGTPKNDSRWFSSSWRDEKVEGNVRHVGSLSNVSALHPMAA